MTRTGDANDDVEATRDQRRRDRAALQSSAARRCRAAKAAALAALENMSAPSKAPPSADARPLRRGVATRLLERGIRTRLPSLLALATRRLLALNRSLSFRS